MIEPALSLYQRLHELEQEYSVVLSYTQGFPLADTYYTGPCVFGYGLNQRQVDGAIDALYEAILLQREAFCSHYYSPAEAIASIKDDLQHTTQPIVFADTQDIRVVVEQGILPLFCQRC